MRKLLAYPLSIIYYLAFGLMLVIFHPIQWFCFRFFGYQAHKKSVDYLNFFLLRCLNILGTSFQFENPYQIELNQPCIIVANHQGQYDIPPIIWYLRKLHPKFISKKSLGKGIPSISFNLRHGGSVLIDRKESSQAITAIQGLTVYLNKHHRSVVIFPEGTRSRDGIPIQFARKGLETLLEYMPNALIIPITINNSWKLMRWGAFPLDIGVRVRHVVHQPIKISDFSTTNLIDHIENTILSSFKTIKSRHKNKS